MTTTKLTTNGPKRGLQYPPHIREQAQMLRLAGHSIRDIQRQLDVTTERERPGLWTIWTWCKDAPSDSVQHKYKEYEHRLASMAQSLLEVKLQDALERPGSVNLVTANIVAGTRIDKLIAFERLDQDRQHNSALDILAAIATRQQQLQAESGKSSDAMWRIIPPDDATDNPAP